jgi:hypothetical protein
VPQVQVGQHDTERLTAQALEPICRARGRHDLVAALTQRRRDRLKLARPVYEQDTQRWPGPRGALLPAANEPPASIIIALAGAFVLMPAGAAGTRRRGLLCANNPSQVLITA